MAIHSRLLCALLCTFCIAASAAQPTPIRFGVSETLPFFDHRLMLDWQQYLQQQLGRPVELIHRASHNDIFNLLANGELDFAWICPAIYQRNQQRATLVAMPLFLSKPYYQMLLLAPAANNAANPVDISTIEDLRDKVIAFAEPDTNFGSNLIERALVGRDIDPEHFFRRRFYTGDHDKVLHAVANGLAHGGAVTNQTWETVRSEDPASAAQLQVIWVSGWRPLPPIVASTATRATLISTLSKQLQHMQGSAAGQRILARLHFDRFIAADPQLFQQQPPDAPSAADPLLQCGP